MTDTTPPQPDDDRPMTRLEVVEKDFADLEAEHSRLIDTVRMLLSTLCFYGNPDLYNTANELENDEGRRARQALGAAYWPPTGDDGGG